MDARPLSLNAGQDGVHQLFLPRFNLGRQGEFPAFQAHALIDNRLFRRARGRLRCGCSGQKQAKGDGSQAKLHGRPFLARLAGLLGRQAGG